MKRTRQNSLQDRLSAMFRILPGVAASALVFSLVFFSPLFDMKGYHRRGCAIRRRWWQRRRRRRQRRRRKWRWRRRNSAAVAASRWRRRIWRRLQGGGDDFAEESRKKSKNNLNRIPTGNSNKSASEKSRSDGLLRSYHRASPVPWVTVSLPAELCPEARKGRRYKAAGVRSKRRDQIGN